jgi:hypothetical protein
LPTGRLDDAIVGHPDHVPGFQRIQPDEIALDGILHQTLAGMIHGLLREDTDGRDLASGDSRGKRDDPFTDVWGDPVAVNHPG